MSTDLKLYTTSSPNGWKITILLEELKAAYGLNYEWVMVSPLLSRPSTETRLISIQQVHLSQGQQKEPWFLAINPVGKIPALVDFSIKDDEHPNGLNIMESAAILLHIAKTRDTKRLFIFDPSKPEEVAEWSEMMQWVLFSAATFGPALGNCRSTICIRFSSS